MVRVLLVLALVGSAAAVLVFKCCPDRQTLTKGGCAPGGPASWAPVVYSPSNKRFLPPGTTPAEWEILTSDPQVCKRPRFLPLEQSLPSFVLFDNGSMLWQEKPANFVPPGGYCIDSAGALACVDLDDGPSESTSTAVSVRKCCGPGAEYSEKNESCITSETDHPQFDGLRVQAGFPLCKELGSFAIGGKLNSTHWLQGDGSLLGGERPLAGAQYCLERVNEHPEEPLHVFICPSRPHPGHEHDIKFTIYPVGLFLSVFFLAVTLIASCLLPSTYHVLHWRCQTNHVACLLVGDLLLAVTQLSDKALEGPACKSIAIAMHFFFLAAFFWLNTMCFNIWWTFRDLRPASLDKGQEACRLRLYELYAWGGPLLIAGVAALVDSLPKGAYSNFLRPRFGERRCWFYGDAELLSYFFGPIGVLLLLNLTLFAATARELTCGLWKTEVVKSNTERATLGRVCLKLVVVMGVTWVADVVSWVVGGPDYVWYLTDFVNALQGVLIFAVVGCQPQVWAAVKRLWCLRELPSDGGNARSSSSHALPSLGDQNTSITKPVETLC